jgi:hypothetical protein
MIDWESVIDWKRLDELSDDEVKLLYSILTKEDNNA